jgi:hypothetical protein
MSWDVDLEISRAGCELIFSFDLMMGSMDAGFEATSKGCSAEIGDLTASLGLAAVGMADFE